MLTRITIKKPDYDSKGQKFHWQRATLAPKDTITVDENTPYELHINLAEHDKLYIGGLEYLKGRTGTNFRMHHDHLGYYLVHLPFPLVLDLYRDPKHRYLPGHHLLHLVHQHTDFYTWLNVAPKLLSDAEYDQMVLQLEKIGNGLSKAARKGYHGKMQPTLTAFGAHDDMILQQLRQGLNAFKRNLYMLQQNPKTEISTSYQWSHNYVRSIDARGLEAITRRPENKKFYTKRPHLDYNSSANLRLKNQLMQIERLVQRLKNKFKGSSSFLNQYQQMIGNVLTTSWLRDVDEQADAAYAGQQSMNPIYLFMTEFWRKLNQAVQQQPTIVPTNDLKTTDQLYEIWGYFKVLDAFQKLCFVPEPSSSLRLLKAQLISHSILFGVRSGSYLKLKASTNDLSVNVVYDEPLPRFVEDAHPLYINSHHNRPDIRMDFYDQHHVFIGTVIIDVKYRELNKVLQSGTGSAYPQLLAYKQNISSHRMFAGTNYDRDVRHMISTVRSVGILAPGDLKAGRHVPNLGYALVKHATQQGIFPLIVNTSADRDLLDYLKTNIQQIIKVQHLIAK